MQAAYPIMSKSMNALIEHMRQRIAQQTADSKPITDHDSISAACSISLVEGTVRFDFRSHTLDRVWSILLAKRREFDSRIDGFAATHRERPEHR